MATFVASKFDPETDPDRPKVGDEFTYGGPVRIEKVDWIETSKMLAAVAAGDETFMAPGEYAECLIRPHTTRPGVQWLVWLNEVKEKPCES